MNTTYFIVCDEYRIIRELGEIPIAGAGPQTDEDATEYGEWMQDPAVAFCAGLLLGFMADYAGLPCRFLNDQDHVEELVRLKTAGYVGESFAQSLFDNPDS